MTTSEMSSEKFMALHRKLLEVRTQRDALQAECEQLRARHANHEYVIRTLEIALDEARAERDALMAERDSYLADVKFACGEIDQLRVQLENWKSESLLSAELVGKERDSLATQLAEARKFHQTLCDGPEDYDDEARLSTRLQKFIPPDARHGKTALETCLSEAADELMSLATQLRACERDAQRLEPPNEKRPLYLAAPSAVAAQWDRHCPKCGAEVSVFSSTYICEACKRAPGATPGGQQGSGA